MRGEDENHMSEEKFYTITNWFMFGRIFSDPDNVRPLLEVVLGVPIGEIRYVSPEHEIEPSIIGRGVRMDVFVDDGSGTVYDVEMQNSDREDLELRSRYLLSSFDRDRISRGTEYVDLGKSVVIFVCTFDPFNLGDRVYTVRPMIVGRDIPFDDKTLRVFLNAKGARTESKTAASVCGQDGDGKDKRLSAFLSYVDGGDTMGDEWVARLDEQVHALNTDQGWRDTMVSYDMMISDEKRRARREGLAEGREEGLAEGREEGLAEGREEGLAEGRKEGLAEGRKEGSDSIKRLYRLLGEQLRNQGREGELMEAVLDPSRLDVLLAEFGIDSSSAN